MKEDNVLVFILTCELENNKKGTGIIKNSKWSFVLFSNNNENNRTFKKFTLNLFSCINMGFWLQPFGREDPIGSDKGHRSRASNWKPSPIQQNCVQVISWVLLVTMFLFLISFSKEIVEGWIIFASWWKKVDCDNAYSLFNYFTHNLVHPTFILFLWTPLHFLFLGR